MSRPEEQVKVNARHRHATMWTPPERCDECGTLWKRVIDGRAGRARRERQMKLWEVTR